MPKLLQINVVANWGSTGRIAEEIGQLAISKGWESYIAYGRGNPHSKSHLIRVGSNLDMYSHVLQSRLMDNHGLVSKNVTEKFIKQIDRISPDIIHSHNIHGYYLNYPILFDYLSQRSIPVIWTLHDCWPFTGHCAYYTYIKCERWKSGCYNCPQKNAYPASFIFDNSSRNYKFKKQAFNSIDNLIMVPVSKWLAGDLKQSFLGNYPIKVINNGVDLNIFKPLDQDLANKKFTILGVASVWEKRKGLDDFIQLSQKLSDDFQIVLVGLNKNQIKSLPSQIKAIERTNNISELVKLYNTADVFFNPTWEDNFPTTNLEALASGTPVLTYRTGGSIEAVDGNTGFIIEPGNIDEVIVAIKHIQMVGKSTYSRYCRERAEKLYNKEDRYNEYIQLYNKLTHVF